MKNTCFKLLSLSLALIMVIGVFPAVSLTAFAAAKGTSASDPVFVNTYEGLRDALANPEITYVKLGSTPGVAPLAVGTVYLDSSKYAMIVVGKKTLTLAGTARFGNVGGNSGLIALTQNSSLTIDGNGTLQYYHGCATSAGYAITLIKSGATLNVVSDSVTIEGAGSGDKLYDLYGNLVKEEENYAYSVYASDGTVNISGGNFIGVRYTFTSDKETYPVVISGPRVKANISGGTFYSKSWLEYYNQAYGIYLQSCTPDNVKITGGVFCNGARVGNISTTYTLTSYLPEGYIMVNDVDGTLVSDSKDDVWKLNHTYTVYNAKSLYGWGNFNPTWEDESKNSMTKSGNIDQVVNFSFNSAELSDEIKAKGFSVKKAYYIKYNNVNESIATKSSTADSPLNGTVRFEKSGYYTIACMLYLMYHGKQVDSELRGIIYVVKEDEQLPYCMASVDNLMIGSTMPKATNEAPEFTWLVFQWYTSDAFGNTINAVNNGNRVQPGSYYVLEIRALGLLGYELANNAVCYLNGEQITGTVNDDGVGVFRAYYATHENYVNITGVEAPRGGMHSDDYLDYCVPTVDDNFIDQYDQTAFFWMDENGKTFNGIFEEGKLYYFGYEVIRDGGGLGGYPFASVNGEVADDIDLQYSAYLLVKKAFYATERIYDFDVQFSDNSKFNVGSTATVDVDKTEKITGASLSGYAITYQWYLNGEKVEGATGKSYTFKEADLGKKVSVVINGGALWGKSSERVVEAKLENSGLKGDVNGDEYVDALDAAMILKYDAGIITDVDETTADVNGDGYVDALDAAMILRYDAGIIESFD